MYFLGNKIISIKAEALPMFELESSGVNPFIEWIYFKYCSIMAWLQPVPKEEPQVNKHIQKGEELFKQGKTREAIAQFSKVTDFPRKTDTTEDKIAANFNLASCYLIKYEETHEKRDYEIIEECLGYVIDTINQTKNQFMPTFTKLSAGYLSYLYNNKELSIIWENLGEIEADPTLGLFGLRKSKLINSDYTFMYSEYPEQEKKFFDMIIANDLKKRKNLIELSHIYFDNKKWALAERALYRAFDKAHRKKQKVDLLNKLLKCLEEQNKQEELIYIYKKLIILDPMNVLPLLRLALCYWDIACGIKKDRYSLKTIEEMKTNNKAEKYFKKTIAMCKKILAKKDLSDNDKVFHQYYLARAYVDLKELNPGVQGDEDFYKEAGKLINDMKKNPEYICYQEHIETLKDRLKANIAYDRDISKLIEKLD